MSSRFNDVSQENVVTVIFEQETTLGNYEVLFQKWHANGIAGNSFIFVTDDIAELNDNELEELIRTSSFFEDTADIALRRSTRYTSVNFNMKRI